MHQKHPRIISSESPHRTRVRIHHDGIPAHGNGTYRLCPIPHGCVLWRAVDDLELVAVHVPWVGTCVKIIDYYFDAVRVLLVAGEERREREGVHLSVFYYEGVSGRSVDDWI
jgi:hypothetical protein